MKTIASILIMLIALLLPISSIQGKYREYSSSVTLKGNPKRVVHNFLMWYKKNRTNLQKFRLVRANPGDSTKAYRVDFKETEKYLTELKKSGFLSDQYINSFRQYFETADANLKMNPQYDGPAEGFGFDLVLKAEEADEILDRIPKLKMVTKPIDPDTTKVYVKLPYVYMVLKLIRSGNTWLIDSLDYV